MKAAYIEFRLESATMNTRESYASKQGTHKYLTKGAIACAITYGEVLQRNKKDNWSALAFDFDCTPAIPINIRTMETIYKAGDKADAGLLTYGRQELIMPGSVFRFVAWGGLPPLWEGQVFLIGKKRAAARVITCIQSDVQPDTGTLVENVMPIQVPPLSLVEFSAFIPLVLTAYYAIVQVPLQPGYPRLILNGWGVPLGKQQNA